jgi:MFS family permease
LGIVSFFMDISSEMIHALLPLFLTTGLGASVALVGLIEGVAEAAASIAKAASGLLSDRMGRRKPLIVLGYALGALAKPFFALAGAPTVVLAARFADRIGKGIRVAPRDALVADVTPQAIRGAAYSLRQALDAAGALTGPVLAIALMALLEDNIRAVFWLAALPAAVAVLVVLIGVEDCAARSESERSRPTLRLADWRGFGRAFWSVVVIGVVFTLARFSEAFLVLKAHDNGLPLALAPLVLVVLKIVYSVGAYPAGAWSDRRSPATLLLWALAALIVADLFLALSPGLSGAFAGVALWGAHMALTQGLLAKLIAQSAPAARRASAFGLFNLATGVAMLAASAIAGLFWDGFGPAAPFLTGASLAVFAAALILLHVRKGGRALL